MLRKSYLPILFIAVLTSGCAATHKSIIETKSNELQAIETTNIANLLGGSKDVIFTIDDNDIKVDYALTNIEYLENKKINEQNKVNQANNRITNCIRIAWSDITSCSNNLGQNIFDYCHNIQLDLPCSNYLVNS